MKNQGNWRVEQHLFHCKDSTLFWKKPKKLDARQFGNGFQLTVFEVLFGIPINNCDDTRLLNFLLLKGKWYINNK